MGKIKIKKDFDKMAIEKGDKNESNEGADVFDYAKDTHSNRNVRIDNLLTEVDRTDVGRKLI